MRQLVVTLAVLSLASLGLAQDLITPSGIGAGGHAYSATFNPQNIDEMLLAQDMCGINVSYLDGGIRWRPDNDGIVNPENRQSSHAYDVHAYEYNGAVYYVAATVGGLFERAATTTTWTSATPPVTYHYVESAGGYPVARAIPFSCVDDNGEGMLVAGAGLATHSREQGPVIDSNALWAYPQLDDIQSTPFGTTQYTVWIKESPSGTWQPYTRALNECAFGGARDIQIRKIGRTNYILVTTDRGIYMHDFSPSTPWVNLAEVDASVYDVVRGPLRSYGCSDITTGGGLHPWNVFLTERGVLYATVSRHRSQPEYVSGSEQYAGVYRIDDLFGPPGDWEWRWIGNASALPRVPLQGHQDWYWDETISDHSALSLDYLARADLVESGDPSGEHLPRAHPIYLTVVEGDGDTEPDVLYLGCGKIGTWGLLKGTEDDSQVNGFKWIDQLYTTRYGRTPYSYNGSGTLHELTEGEFGWAIGHGVDPNFKPAVIDDGSGNLRILLHCGTSLLLSTDSGNSWQQIYDDYDGNGFKTKGYNEVCVNGMALHANDQLVLSAGDCGIFEENAAGTFEYYDLDDGPSDFEWPSATHPNMETGRVAIVDNWQGTTGTATVFVAGEIVQGVYSSNKLIAKDEYGTLTHVTKNLPWSPTIYVMRDFVFADGSTVYLACEILAGGGSQSTAVYRGSYLNGEWAWTLEVDNLTTWLPLDLEYFSEYDRLFLASGNGVWACETTDMQWVPVLGQSNNLPEYSRSRCLARDTAGTRLYIGTMGSVETMDQRIGTVLKCTDPGVSSINSLVFEPLINTELGGTPLPRPFAWPVTYLLPSCGDWDQGLTAVYDIAVKPDDADVIAVGLDNTWGNQTWGDFVRGFFPQLGLWLYGRNHRCPWEKVYANTPYEGLPVWEIEFSRVNDDLIYVGHDGYGVLEVDLAELPVPTCGNGGGGDDPGNPLFGLRIHQSGLGAGQVTFALSLARTEPVALKVYDIRGRLVSRTEYGSLAVGEHRLHWDGKGRDGSRVASGIYFARVQAGDAAATQKFTMLR